VVDGCELLASQRVGRPVHIWEELGGLVLASWQVQGSVTPVIVVDIGVSAGAIDVILETLPVLTEVGDGCLFGALFAAELAVASLILIHCEHVCCVGRGIY